MKKAITIIGIIGSILILFSFCFKALHFPGAASIVILGALSLFIYLLLYMLEYIKIITTKIGKTFAIILGLCGVFMIFSFAFKIMHWPGAGILILVFFVLYDILIVVSFIRAILEKNKELKYTFFNYFIFILGFGMMLLFPASRLALEFIASKF